MTEKKGTRSVRRCFSISLQAGQWVEIDRGTLLDVKAAVAASGEAALTWYDQTRAAIPIAALSGCRRYRLLHRPRIDHRSPS